MTEQRDSRQLTRDRQRGRLHVYVGGAPGVGKTYAMLERGQRLAARGDDVVIGWVETHDRERLTAMLGGLELISPATLVYRGASFQELDVDAVLARRPDVVLIDELAHTNIPGARHEKRWQDVDELLEAGIDVITDLNVQHIDRLASTATALTGIFTRETVPDAVVLAADSVEVVEVTPDELRDRVSRGEIYRDDYGDVALGGYFTAGNLSALQDLARRWLEAHRTQGSGERPIDDALLASAGGPVVAALTGDRAGEHLVRRAAELARASGGALVGVRVREPSGLEEKEPPWLGRQRRLLTELGGRYAEVAGVDVAGTVLEAARAEQARHLVLGATRRSPRDELFHGSVINRAIRQAGDIEIHVIPSRETPARRAWGGRYTLRRTTRVPLPPQRRILGWALAFLAPLVVAAALLPLRSTLGLAGALFAVLLAVVLAAVVGGVGPAAAATIVGLLASDFLFAVPYYSLRVDRALDVVALIAFAVVAGVIGLLVDILAREGVQVAGATAQAESLARLAAESIATPEHRWDETTDSIRRTFALDAVALLRRDDSKWWVQAAAGDPVPTNPADASMCVELPHGRTLAFVRSASSPDQPLLDAFVSGVRLATERTQLRRITGRSAPAR